MLKVIPRMGKEVEVETVSKDMSNMELLQELKKLQTKEVTVSVYQGIEGLHLYKALDFYTAKYQDNNADNKIMFSDCWEEESELNIKMRDIKSSNIQSDIISKCIMIFLNNGQFMQIMTDTIL